jgi:hypothetical protein
VLLGLGRQPDHQYDLNWWKSKDALRTMPILAAAGLIAEHADRPADFDGVAERLYAFLDERKRCGIDPVGDRYGFLPIIALSRPPGASAEFVPTTPSARTSATNPNAA